MTSDATRNLWRATRQNCDGYPRVSQDICTDLLVIGGGFTGNSAALEAACSGADVVVLEADTIGHGGSGRNVGLVNAGLWVPPEGIIKQLGQTEGMRLITALASAPDTVFDLIEREGIECEATRNGTLHLAHAPSGLRDLKDRLRQGKQIDAPIQLLDAKETARRTGSDAFLGALFDPRAGTIQPLEYCRGLARAAKNKGARIFEQSPAQHVTHDGSEWIVRSNENTLRAKHLLLATNGYHAGTEGQSGPQFVTIRYSQFATSPLTCEQRAGILPGGEGCWDTAMVMSSFRVNQEGRLIVGGIGDCDGQGATIHTRWAARKMAEVFPELAGKAFDYTWQGTIAMTGDHLPKAVRIGPNGLTVFGYSGRGIGPGTVFGKQAARALLFDEVDGMPSTITETPHLEPFKFLRSLYFETGATLVHALSR